jgi:drug/metabolite transporter (DMT)-like permease
MTDRFRTTSATGSLAGRRFLADAVLLLATLIWGTSFVVVKEGLVEISPFLFVALRFSLAAVVLGLVLLLKGKRVDRTAWKGGAVVGLTLFAGFALQTLGLREVAPARAAFLTGLCVVTVPLLVVLLYHRIPSRTSLAGAALATVGLGLLTGISHGGLGRGDWLLIGCAVTFGFQILAVDRYSATAGPFRLLWVELVVVAVVSWCCALFVEVPRWPSTLAGWSIVTYAALLATLVAFGAQNWAQQSTPPTRAGIILTLEPVFAALVSYLVTGERLGSSGVIGSALILAGMIAAETGPTPRD